MKEINKKKKVHSVLIPGTIKSLEKAVEAIGGLETLSKTVTFLPFKKKLSNFLNRKSF